VSYGKFCIQILYSFLFVRGRQLSSIHQNEVVALAAAAVAAAAVVWPCVTIVNV